MGVLRISSQLKMKTDVSLAANANKPNSTLKKLISLTILILTYSIGSGQICSGPLNISIDGSDSGQPLKIEYIHSNVYCAETASGAIELSIGGGTPGYSCMWSTGDTLPALFNLNPGMYQVTVTDAVDCTTVLAVDIGTLDPADYNLTLAVENGCGRCTLKDSTSTYLFMGVDYLVEVIDLYDLKDLGEIEACIEIADYHLIFQERPFLRRSWTLKSSDNKAALKLFFTEEELMDLLNFAGYDEIGQALPSRLSIRKFDGAGTRPDSYEVVHTQTNIQLKRFQAQEGIWYIDVPNILFEEGQPTSLYLEIIPVENIVSSTELEPVIEYDTDLEFYVYSNPVVDVVRIGEDHATNTGTGIITMYNKLGQELFKEEFYKEDLDGKDFNVVNYTPGLYLIVIQYKDRDFTQTLKFIKV